MTSKKDTCSIYQEYLQQVATGNGHTKKVAKDFSPEIYNEAMKKYGTPEKKEVEKSVQPVEISMSRVKILDEESSY